MLKIDSKKILKKIKNIPKDIKKSIRKDKKKWAIGSAISLLVLLLSSYLIFFVTHPNDRIIYSNDGYSILKNINPNFNVSFGNKENESKQVLRFESKSSLKNPFEEKEITVFDYIKNIFRKKDKLGIEMSLSGVDIEYTEGYSYSEEISSVAELLGTNNISTNTQLVQSGREIGVYDKDSTYSKDTVINSNVADGVDIEYQILKGLGVKEEIVIRDLEEYRDSCSEDVSKCKLPLNEFVFDLKLDEGVQVREGWYTVDGTSTQTYYFTDSNGNYIAHLLPSYAIDNAGNKTIDVKLEIEENNKIKVIVPLDWLLSSDRIYPVRIDPSIVHDESGDFDGGVFDRVELNSGPSLEIEKPEGISTDSNTIFSYKMDYPTGIPEDWYDESWSYRSKVTIASSQVAENLDDYPVYVDLSLLPSGFHSHVLDGGGDIRVTTSDGETEIPREVVFYTASSDTGELYFKADLSSSTNNEFYIYYGNSSASNYANNATYGAENVWTNGYQSVWHFNETSGTQYDSTSTSNDTTTISVTTQGSATGKFGGANSYNPASSNYLAFSSAPAHSTTDLTVEAWANPTNITGGPYTFVSDSSWGNNGYRIVMSQDDYAYQMGNGSASTWEYSNSITTGFHYFAFTFDRPTTEMYYDGADVGGGTWNYDITQSTDTLYIGKTTSTNWYMNGVIDEVRISSVSRSAGWISTQYDNQNTPSTFLTIGSEETGSVSEGVLADSKNGYNGTLYGTSYTDGKIDGGLLFDGVDDYVDLSSHVANIEGLNNGTIMGWFKTKTTSNTYGQMLFSISYSTAATNYVYIGIDNETSTYTDESFLFVVRRTNADKLRAYVRKGQGYYSDNKWHHFAVTVSSSGNEIYIDGIKQTVTYATGTAATQEFTNIDTPNAVRISSRKTSAYDDMYLNGIADDYFMSSSALTSTQIRRAYLNGYLDRYSGIFTSEVVDLTSSVDLPSFDWLSGGVLTGDGQIPYSTTDLIAKWDFDEGSGASILNDTESSCGSDCDGTISGTGSSSWSDTNKRWGDYALIFDGVDDYIYFNEETYFDPTNISVAFWVKAPDNVATQTIPIVSRISDSGDTGYQVGIQASSGYPIVDVQNINNERKTLVGSSRITDNNWHYVIMTYDSTDIDLYVDGLLEATTTSSAIAYGEEELVIGRESQDTDIYFTGVLDAMSIYSRAMSSSEVVSNYQSGNIEIQYRTSTDGTTWGNWLPDTNDVQLDAKEGYLYNTTDTGLVSYWPMDETSGTSVADVKNSYNGTATGTTIYNGVYNKGRYFNGTSDYITVSNNSAFYTNNLSVEFWIKTTDTTAGLISYQQGAGLGGLSLYISSSIIGANVIGSSTYSLSSLYTITDNNWHHVAFIFDYTNSYGYFYIDGLLTNSSSTSGISMSSNAYSYFIGKDYLNTYLVGYLDEVRHYNTALSSSVVAQHSQEGLRRISLAMNSPMVDSNIKLEGSGSEKFGYSNTKIDANTVAYWKMDESTTSGAYIKDSSSYGNNATPVGTSYVSSDITGTARSFNGTSDYMTLADSSSLDIGNVFTISAWIKPDSLTARVTIYSASASATTGALQFEVGPGNAGTNRISTLINGTWVCATVDGVLTPGVWQHIAYVRTATGANHRMYVNGVSVSLATNGSTNYVDNAHQKLIGARSTVSQYQYFPGSIDELQISNIARSADEIWGMYLMGRNQYQNTTITSTDASEKSVLKYSIASDMLGKGLDTIVGESLYSNYQPDEYTTNMWHLDEDSGTTLRNAISSSTATATGTKVVSGVLGNARLFNGTSDLLTIADSTDMKLNSTNWSIEFWAKKVGAGTGASPGILWKGGGATAGTGGYNLYVNSDTLIFKRDNDTGLQIPGFSKEWTYYAFVCKGPSQYAYKNGVLVDTNSVTYATNTSTSVAYVGRGDSGHWLNGIVDELRISNTNRTEQAIKQAYEIQKRKFSTYIEFKANLQSSNLITGSSDTSFTISETPYGTTNAIEHLYVGDKIIVKENIEGVEYIAQGSVATRNVDTGAVTVSAWDSGGTYPTGGFTSSAILFKWQEESFSLMGISEDQRDALTTVSYIFTQSYGANIWVDNVYIDKYLDSVSTDISSDRYFQYRVLFTTSNPSTSPSLNKVYIDYESSTSTPTTDLLMRHGKWFSGGTKQSYWWAN